MWGAALSTGLAAIKIFEVWRERPRLTTSWSFSSSPAYGENEIIIENPTKTPVMISYWELLWLERRRLKHKVMYGRFPDAGYCNITIGAHSRHILGFTESEYFDAARTVEKFGDIYLRLYVVGRHKPMLLKVYGGRASLSVRKPRRSRKPGSAPAA
jgi:hypothetical protein